jgi:hypothetical protein
MAVGGIFFPRRDLCSIIPVSAVGCGKGSRIHIYTEFPLAVDGGGEIV